MHCPSCGTENAPDSRFCGGCGARFGPPSARVAPTQKISDDESFSLPPAAAHSPAQSAYAAPVAASPPRVTPPQYVPPVTPPAYVPPAPSAAPASASSAPIAPRTISSPPSPAPHISLSGKSPAPHISLGGRPASKPPTIGPAISPPPMRLDGASRSLAPAARRPWPLIIAVLVIDVGLAAAGAWLLREGLADRSQPPASASSTPSASKPP